MAYHYYKQSKHIFQTIYWTNILTNHKTGKLKDTRTMKLKQKQESNTPPKKYISFSSELRIAKQINNITSLF